jgi:hypothetical protein
MASTYTTGFGIEKIGSGEQSGAWGTTTNHNLDILDRIASYKAVALSGTTHTLTVREASPGSGTENLQDGMYRVIKFTGALGGNNTVTIAPNTAPAYFIFENATTDSGSSGPYSVILTQGSGANITIQNGKNAIVYCDGAGSGAAVVNALSDLQIATLEVTGVAAIDGALTAAAITATTVTTSGIVSVDDTTTSTSGTTGSIHTDGGLGVAGTAFVAGAATVGGASQFNSTVTVGVNDTGYDVQFFGATSGAHMLWDESADDLKLVGAAGLTVAGNIDVDGTTNLDAVDIDGAVQLDGTLTVGVNDTGYDVKFFGAASGSYMLWDESTDDLILGGAAQLGIGTTAPYSQLDVYSTIASPTSGEASGVGTIRITNGATALTSAGGLEFKNAGDSNGYGAKIQALNSSGAQLVFANRGASATWTERMRLDASGNVGIGTTAPTQKIQGVIGTTGGLPATSGTTQSHGILRLNTSNVGTCLDFGVDGATTAASWIQAAAQNNLATNWALALNPNGGNVGINIAAPTGNLQVIGAAGSELIIGYAGAATNYMDAATQIFRNASKAETMRIDSGGFTYTNCTSSVASVSSYSNIAFNGAAYFGISIKTTYGGAGSTFAAFINSAGTRQGSIYANATSSVQFLTSSDYRLKENIAPMTGALAKVSALKPVTYNWKSDGSASQGFIAHELAEVSPECVGGEKDAVDAEGKPQYQGVDTSFLVATLTAAIQEQQATIEALTARITALEG